MVGIIFVIVTFSRSIISKRPDGSKDLTKMWVPPIYVMAQVA
jgi:hypothetical protein